MLVTLEHSSDIWHCQLFYQNIYQDSSCYIKTESRFTEFFSILLEMQQGCILPPLFFLIILDYIPRSSDTCGHSFKLERMKLNFRPCQWLSSSSHQLHKKVDHDKCPSWTAEKVGWRVNIPNTKTRKVVCSEAHEAPIMGKR